MKQGHLENWLQWDFTWQNNILTKPLVKKKSRQRYSFWPDWATLQTLIEGLWSFKILAAIQKCVGKHANIERLSSDSQTLKY